MSQSRPWEFSLNQRLSLFWVFTAVVVAALSWALGDVYDQGAGSVIRRASRVTEQGCAELQAKFKWSVENGTFEKEREGEFQRALSEIILSHYSGVEGGFWSEAKSFVAYAYPTYEGSSVKRDVPAAEKEKIEAAAKASLAAPAMLTETGRGQREAMILTACRLEGATSPSVAWTMARVPLGLGLSYDRLFNGLCLLLAFVALSGVGLTFLVWGWTKKMRQLEATLTDYPVGQLPPLELTREAELNRIITAFNRLSERLRAERGESQKLSRQLAQSGRLVALGKMAAGLAHEIRNPLGTMRLKIENAQAQPFERMPKAVPILLEQINRMDRLVQMTLAMTQSFELKPVRVELREWADSRFAELRLQAEQKGISLRVECQVEAWTFDPFHMARAIENLLANAISFTPSGGQVRLRFFNERAKLIIEIQDSGPGLSREMAEHLFEPFATSRVGGTGLGLVLVREVAEAHGGKIELISPHQAETERAGELVSELVSGLGGAGFRLEIP